MSRWASLDVVGQSQRKPVEQKPHPRRGLQVAVQDPNPAAEAYVGRYIANTWPTLQRLGMAADASADRWSFHTCPIAAVRGAAFVQENAPERLDIKRALYAEIDAALPPDAILASSSSGLMMSDLQPGLASAPLRSVVQRAI